MMMNSCPYQVDADAWVNADSKTPGDRLGAFGSGRWSTLELFDTVVSVGGGASGLLESMSARSNLLGAVGEAEGEAVTASEMKECRKSAGDAAGDTRVELGAGGGAVTVTTWTLYSVVVEREGALDIAGTVGRAERTEAVTVTT